MSAVFCQVFADVCHYDLRMSAVFCQVFADYGSPRGGGRKGRLKTDKTKSLVFFSIFKDRRRISSSRKRRLIYFVCSRQIARVDKKLLWLPHLRQVDRPQKNRPWGSALPKQPLRGILLCKEPAIALAATAGQTDDLQNKGGNATGHTHCRPTSSKLQKPPITDWHIAGWPTTKSAQHPSHRAKNGESWRRDFMA